MASTLIALMAVIGFWPSYLQPLFTGESEAGQVIHFHATVYFGWLALFVSQAWLAAFFVWKTWCALTDDNGHLMVADATGRSRPASRGCTRQFPCC